MQFKLTFLTTLFTIASLAAATDVSAPTPDVPKPDVSLPTDQCTTGQLLCCNSFQTAESPLAAALIGLLNIAVGDVTAPVGVTCTPVTVIGAGGNSCPTQPTCCTNNAFNGIVALGCSPVNVSA